MKKTGICFFVLLFSMMGAAPLFALNVRKLSHSDVALLDSILKKTAPLIQEKEAHGSAVLISFEEFEKNLSVAEKKWIEKVLALTPEKLNVKTPRQKKEMHAPPMRIISGQVIQKNGEPFIIPPQAVSPAVFAAYEKMMFAMEKDLRKRLYIESGHRGEAFHLYNFLKYLVEHHYSLLETAKLNALPGYSEHNLKINHAIDFINGKGVNGELRAEDYEVLPEHTWMLKHAKEYGFALSYPRNNSWGISFEPWHWKLNISAPTIKTRNKTYPS